MDARAVLDRAMSENDLLVVVLAEARLRGWRSHHGRPARTASGWRTAVSGDAGFPDIVLVHPVGDLIVAELKSERGQPDPAQRLWIAGFTVAGIDTYLWRPRDMPTISARRARAYVPYTLSVPEQGAGQ
jgi:hypothetical protein